MSTGMKGERRINTILEDPGTGKAGEENMEREVKSLLTENEDIVSGKDSGLCSSCEGGIMENCDDFKTNRVGETITGKRVVKKC